MNIETTRFGRIEIDETRVIDFPEGLLGFPEQKRYVLLEHRPDSPFCWLQSVDQPELAFVLTNPFLVDRNYLKDLSPGEAALLGGKKGDLVTVFALVTIPPGQVEKMTVNLIGPLIIEADTRTGRQVVLPNSGYSHNQPFPMN
ncbi:MAG: flagellar assembly protein FliW [Desulfatiglandales bacterium]